MFPTSHHEQSEQPHATPTPGVPNTLAIPRPPTNLVDQARPLWRSFVLHNDSRGIGDYGDHSKSNISSPSSDKRDEIGNGQLHEPHTNTKFGDLFAFSGPALERINDRLAMIGFVAAFGTEFGDGANIFAQQSSGGFAWFLGTSALLTLASLIPLFQAIRAEKGYTSVIVSVDAKIWNGRFVMLGLVALAFCNDPTSCFAP
nr:early light-induced protein 2, chloroplastic-like [Nicotiana tomentosiformis]